jgi:hypothetical protein
MVVTAKMLQNLIIISIIVLAVVFLIKFVTKDNCNGCKKIKKILVAKAIVCLKNNCKKRFL